MNAPRLDTAAAVDEACAVAPPGAAPPEHVEGWRPTACTCGAAAMGYTCKPDCARVVGAGGGAAGSAWHESLTKDDLAVMQIDAAEGAAGAPQDREGELAHEDQARCANCGHDEDCHEPPDKPRRCEVELSDVPPFDCQCPGFAPPGAFTPPPADDALLLRAIEAGDRAAHPSMTAYGPTNDRWLVAFKAALAAEGVAVVRVAGGGAAGSGAATRKDNE